MDLTTVCWRGTCLLAIAFSVTSCSAGKHMDAAKAAVQKFHEQMDQGKFDDIYTQSEPEMKQASKQEDAVRFLRSVATNLGKYQSSK